MTTQAFLAVLDERIGRYDLLSHPYYKAWSAGELSRDDLREYASDYYHHVAAFPACLSAFHSRLEDGELRRAVLRNLSDEEIEGRPHSEMWLDFAEGMGADRTVVRQRHPGQHVTDLVDTFRRIAQEGSALEVLACFYAYESQVPRIAKTKAQGLTELYGADAKTCAYFKLHQFADVEHSRVWRDLLLQEVQANPDEAGAALDSAECAARALWQTLDGMEARRMAKI